MERKEESFLNAESEVSVWSRVLAKIVDLLMIMIILLLGKLIWMPIGFIASCIFTALLDTMGNGQSMGKKILGLKVVERNTSIPCNRIQSIIRNIPLFIAVFFFSLGVWALFWLVAVPFVIFELILLIMLDSGTRLGDVLANTCVINVDKIHIHIAK